MIMIILAAVVLRENVHPNIFLKTLSNYYILENVLLTS